MKGVTAVFDVLALLGAAPGDANAVQQRISRVHFFARLFFPHALFCVPTSE